jgi:hypothetical protein
MVRRRASLRFSLCGRVIRCRCLLLNKYNVSFVKFYYERVATERSEAARAA